MQFYSRRSLKTLLFESIVGQTYFLEEIYKIAKSNEEKGITLGKITKAICEAVDDDEIGFNAARDLSGKQAKKVRSEINTKIHKKVASLKGYDNSSFSLKGIKQFYDNILKYAKEKSDVSLDECMLASDFFMKAFYPICDPETKEKVDLGEYPLDEVFRKTEYFTRFVNNETGLGILRDYSCYEIYEDENVSVVYPKSPLSFVNYIVSQGISINNISWCTRTPITWYNYNKDQYVMILRDKRSRSTDDANYMISLKVNLDGTIDYPGTCDRYNTHMNERSVRSVLSDKAHDGILKNINMIDIDYDVESENIIENIKNLSDINRTSELSELLSACLVIIKEITDLRTVLFAAKDALSTERFVNIILESVVRLYFDTFNSEDENNEEGNLYENRFNLVGEVIGKIGPEAVNLFRTKLYNLARKNGHPRYTTAFLSFDYFDSYSLEDYMIDQDISLKDIIDLFEKSCKNKSPTSLSVLVDAFMYILEKSVIRDDSGDLIDEVSEIPYEFFDTIASSNCFQEYVKAFKLDIATKYFLQVPFDLKHLSESNPIIDAIVGIDEESIRDQITQNSSSLEIKNIDLAMLALSLERNVNNDRNANKSIIEIGELVVKDMSASFGMLSRSINENILANIFRSKEYASQIIQALQSSKRVKFCASLCKFLLRSSSDPSIATMSNREISNQINFLLNKCTENAADFSSVSNAFDSMHRLITFISNLRVVLQMQVVDLDKDFTNEINMYLFKDDITRMSTLKNVISSLLSSAHADKIFEANLETCIQLAFDEEDNINLTTCLLRSITNAVARGDTNDNKAKIVDKTFKVLQSKYDFQKNIDYVLNYKLKEVTSQLSYLDVFNLISFLTKISMITPSSILGFYRSYTGDSFNAQFSSEELSCLARLLPLISNDVDNYSGTIQKIINRISKAERILDDKTLSYVLRPLEIVLQNVNKSNIKLSVNVLYNLLRVIFKKNIELCVAEIMTNMIANAKDKNSLNVAIGKANPANHVETGVIEQLDANTSKYYLECLVGAIKDHVSSPDQIIQKLESDFKNAQSHLEKNKFDEDDPFAGVDFSSLGDFDLYEYLKLKVRSVI